MKVLDTVVVVGGPPGALATVAGRVLETRTPLAFARALLRGRAELVVVQGDVAWASALLERSRAVLRPAVLKVGGSPPAGPEIFDEWVTAEAPPAELRARSHLAVERGRARRRAARRAFVDPLTALPNRRALIRGILRELARSERTHSGLALVLVDLDGFKAVNDRLGHLAGDRLLRRVARSLARLTRRTDLCARIGGDEFAIVVAGGTHAAAATAARVEDALLSNGVSATTGYAVLAPGERLKELYRRADDVLRSAKARKHGHWFESYSWESSASDR